jgi:hypothetical protein
VLCHLTLRVSDLPDAIALTIDAPADARLILAELVDSFRARGNAA